MVEIYAYNSTRLHGVVLEYLKPCDNFTLTYIIWRLPLWSSGQSSWLQIQRSGFDSRRYQIFWEVERGPLSLVSTTVELLRRKSSGSGLESRGYGRRDPSRWPRGTLYPQKLSATSPTSGGRSVGIVRSRTYATECLYYMKRCLRWMVAVGQKGEQHKYEKERKKETACKKQLRTRRRKWRKEIGCCKERQHM
jgi:hypothetical protein